jgi:hypothetical protein
MRSRMLMTSLTAAAGFVVLFANDNLLSSQQSSLIAQADARVGRPLTPGSVAGVARRTDRRAYRRGAVAAGAVATGAVVGTSAYYGAGPYTDGSSYYGTGAYVGTGVERRMARREARRAYYGDQVGSGYGWGLGTGAAAAGAAATAAVASTAYGGWGAGMYTADAATYPTRTIYARDYRTPQYYGPVCSPRFDLGCQ